MNRHISTVIVAPMTTPGRPYPTRVACRFQDNEGQVVLDQIPTVDKSCLILKLGRVKKRTKQDVLATLAEIFRE